MPTQYFNLKDDHRRSILTRLDKSFTAGSNLSSNGDTNKTKRNHAAERRELRKHVKLTKAYNESHTFIGNAVRVCVRSLERCLSEE